MVCCSNVSHLCACSTPLNASPRTYRQSVQFGLMNEVNDLRLTVQELDTSFVFACFGFIALPLLRALCSELHDVVSMMSTLAWFLSGFVYALHFKLAESRTQSSPCELTQTGILQDTFVASFFVARFSSTYPFSLRGLDILSLDRPEAKTSLEAGSRGSRIATEFCVDLGLWFWRFGAGCWFGVCIEVEIGS